MLPLFFTPYSTFRRTPTVKFAHWLYEYRVGEPEGVSHACEHESGRLRRQNRQASAEQAGSRLAAGSIIDPCSPLLRSPPRSLLVLMVLRCYGAPASQQLVAVTKAGTNVKRALIRILGHLTLLQHAFMYALSKQRRKGFFKEKSLPKISLHKDVGEYIFLCV